METNDLETLMTEYAEDVYIDPRIDDRTFPKCTPKSGEVWFGFDETNKFSDEWIVIRADGFPNQAAVLASRLIIENGRRMRLEKTANWTLTSRKWRYSPGATRAFRKFGGRR